MADAYPKAFVAVDVAGFAHALVQAVHIDGVGVVDLGHGHDGLTRIGQFTALYADELKVRRIVYRRAVHARIRSHIFRRIRRFRRIHSR